MATESTLTPPNKILSAFLLGYKCSESEMSSRINERPDFVTDLQNLANSPRQILSTPVIRSPLRGPHFAVQMDMASAELFSQIETRVKRGRSSRLGSILFRFFAAVLALIFLSAGTAQAQFKIVSKGYTPPGEQLQKLQLTLKKFEEKYPQLMTKVKRAGFTQIDLLPNPSSAEQVGLVFASVEHSHHHRQIAIYANYFEFSPGAHPLAPFSLAEVTLLHELLHALDFEDNFTWSYFTLLGWNEPRKNPLAFSLPQYPTLENSWVSAELIQSLKQQYTPQLLKGEHWQVYIKTREQLMKYGYPSIYAVVGGPAETFAELGAYIALDPLAPNYIPADVINWYQQHILR